MCLNCLHFLSFILINLCLWKSFGCDERVTSGFSSRLNTTEWVSRFGQCRTCLSIRTARVEGVHPTHILNGRYSPLKGRRKISRANLSTISIQVFPSQTVPFCYKPHLHQRANTRTSSSQSSRPNSRCIIKHGFLWKPSTPRPRARREEKSFAKSHENSSEYSSKSFQLNFYNYFLTKIKMCGSC